MHLFLFVPVVLGMANASSSTCELDLASSEVLQITHGILMLELAADNVRPDEELCMAVLAETCSLADSVLVNDSERTEVLKIWILV